MELAQWYASVRGIPSSNIVVTPGDWYSTRAITGFNITQAQARAIYNSILPHLRSKNIGAIACMHWWPHQFSDGSAGSGQKTFFYGLCQPFLAVDSVAVPNLNDGPIDLGQTTSGSRVSGAYGFGPQLLDPNLAAAQGAGAEPLSILEDYGIRASRTGAERAYMLGQYTYNSGLNFDPPVFRSRSARTYEAIVNRCKLPESYVWYPTLMIAGQNMTLADANNIATGAGKQPVSLFGPASLPETERVALAMAKRMVENGLEHEATRRDTFGGLFIFPDDGILGNVSGHTWAEVAFGEYPYTFIGPDMPSPGLYNSLYISPRTRPSTAVGGPSPTHPNTLPPNDPRLLDAFLWANNSGQGEASTYRTGAILYSGRSATRDHPMTLLTSSYDASIMKGIAVLVHAIATSTDILSPAAGASDGLIAGFGAGACLSNIALNNRMFYGRSGSNCTMGGDPLYAPFRHWIN
jgi:hypothetical protein